MKKTFVCKKCDTPCTIEVEYMFGKVTAVPKFCVVDYTENVKWKEVVEKQEDDEKQATILKWHLAEDKPEVHRNVIIQFCNDVGFWFAAGIVGLQTDNTYVFVDVISGNAYKWNDQVMRWAYLDEVNK